MAKNENANNQNDQNSRRRQRKEKATAKKGGAGGKIACLLLGFVMGVVGTLGGIGGLGYYAITQVKIKDAVGTVNDLAGLEIDYTEYLNEQYGDSSVFGLVETVIGVVGQLKDGTGSLNTLNEISPMVGVGAQTLIDTVSAYGIKIDYEGLMSTPFSALGDFLTATVNDTDVALLVEAVTQNPVEGVLALICYGEPGEDYITLEDGTVQMLGNSTPITIGSLTNADALVGRLNSLTVYSLMEAFSSVDTSDPIIRALVCGEKNVDYIINDDGSITQLPKTYQLSGEVGSQVFTSPDGVEFTCVDGVWKDANENTIQQCEGYEGTPEYQYEVFNANEELIYSLKFLETDGNLQYYQVYVGGVAQTRKGHYVSDLLGENADLMSIVGKLPLGDLLDLDGSSDPVMLAVAYGEMGVDYTIENNKIIPINPPITINDLIGGNGIEIIKDIPLATVLGIESPLESGVDALLMVLAYGEEDVNYVLLDTNNDGINDDWKWMKDEDGNDYSERTIGFLMEGNGSSLFNDLTIELLMNINATSAPLMRALAYGNEGTHYVLVDGNTGDSDPTRNTVKMLPKRYHITDGEAFDEEHFLVGRVEELQNGIFSVRISADQTEYIKQNPDGGYDVFPSQEAAMSYTESNDTRIYHSKTKLRNLRGSSAQYYIERIELAAALSIDIFGEGEHTPNPLMVQLAYGAEGVHYTLDRENKQIIWLKDNDPTSDSYGLQHHARTIRDMKDTQALLKSVYLDTVLELTYESPDFMLALAYGNDYEIVGTTIDYKTRRTVGDLMGTNSTDLIKGIEMRKIVKLENSNNAMMNYILYGMTCPDESSPNYHVRTLGEFMDDSSKIIDDMIDALTLKEALGEEATKDGLLSHLKDEKLCDLSKKIQTLTIQTVLDKAYNDSIYTYKQFGDEWATAVEVADNTWEAVTYTDNADGTRTWTFVKDGTAAPTPLKGAWKYLLKDSEGTEHLYALADMNEAMDNIPSNINQATLQDLYDDGLIQLDATQDDMLQKNIVKELAGRVIYTGDKEKLGELTVSEMLKYLSSLISVIS